MKAVAWTTLVIACCSAMVLADSWRYAAKLITTEQKFGDTRIVLEIDGRKHQGFPPHTMSIFDKDRLVAKYPNVGFDKIHASEDKQFFLAVSNGGIPGTAFIIFDREGNLIREMKHRFMPDAIYISRSVTLIRAWYDEEKPDVRFDVQNGHLVGLSIRGKQRFDLLKRDLGFEGDGAER